MTKITDLRILVSEGAKPDESTIENIKTSKEEEGKILHDVKVNTMYMSERGLEKYVYTLLFTDKEENTYYERDDDLDVEELEKEDFDVSIEDLEISEENL